MEQTDLRGLEERAQVLAQVRVDHVDVGAADATSEQHAVDVLDVLEQVRVAQLLSWVVLPALLVVVVLAIELQAAG